MPAIFKKFSVTFLSILLLLVISLLLVADNAGRRYTLDEFQLTDLPQSAIAEKKRRDETPRTCLLLCDSTQENNEIYTQHLQDVLSLMRVGYRLVDVSSEAVPDFSAYRTVVIGFQDFDILGGSVVPLCNWVEQGGRVMLFCTPNATPVFGYLSPYLGIAEGGTSYIEISGMRLEEDFMIGAKDFVFHWGEPMLTSMNVRLNDKAHVYAVSDDAHKVPLVWSCESGAGRFVMMNHGFAEKSTRGLTCAAYSLLEDMCIYPVINASSFFLDDFPSPVPMGDGQYIRRDYRRDISSFYSNVWWPDMLKFCDEYGVKYTGVVIETYEDEVDGSFPRQTDIERFTHFGALLLDHGGEIGLHGYNHLPYCFTGFDFKDKVDYNTWKSEDDAQRATTEVLDFIQTLFPQNTPAVYVPPSNILSEQGREFLRKNYPQIKVIASLYLEGEIEYSQEFEISEDGIVEFPRVISGAVLDQYMRWAALNTLNLYYVNSHFIHPDDVLDEDRGAADGWEQLHENLNNYMNWLYTSAPNIRNMTGTDAGRATQRYDIVSVERTDAEDSIHLRLTGFWDEAYLMIRCNGKTPEDVDGGSVSHIGGDYYLLRATSDNVTIQTKGA